MISKRTTEKIKRAWESDLTYLELFYKTIKLIAKIVAVVYVIRVIVNTPPEAGSLINEFISLLK